MRAVAAIDQVSMTIDEARRDPAPLAIDPLRRVDIDRKFRRRTGIGDAAIARGNHALLDQPEPRQRLAQGREPRIVPDPIEALGHAALPEFLTHLRKLDV